MGLGADTIRAIRERTDIVALVGGHVDLKKSGRSYSACCPFHAEKTPSFSVSPDKGLYYCFGCRVGGDAIDFLMRLRGLDFQAAARQLAHTAGVEVAAPSATAERAQALHKQLRDLGAATQKIFHALLRRPEGVAGRAYLRQRQVTPAQAELFGLGYGGGPSQLLEVLGRRGFSGPQLQQAGLLNEGGDRVLFSQRLTFPIRDLEGHVIGFGGRRLEQNSGPKYVNSRETPLFSKRQVLYGLYEGQVAVRQRRRLVIVEGYTDVMAAHRAGIEEAVAALGTAFGPEHAQQCRRLADQVVVLMDADAAGQSAARSLCERLLAQGLQVRVAPLPEGEDPDSLVRRQGPTALSAAVAAAEPALAYFMARVFTADADGVEARAQAAYGLRPLLFALPAGLERDLYLQRLATQVGLPPAELLRHLERQPARAPGSRRRAARPATENGDEEAHPANRNDATGDAGRRWPRAAARELDLLRELLLFPELRPRLAELAPLMEHDAVRELALALARSTAPIDTVLAENCDDPGWLARFRRIRPLADLPLDERALRANRTLDDAHACLQRHQIDVALQDVVRALGAADAQGDATDALLCRKKDLTRRRQVLDRTVRGNAADK